MGQQQTKSQIVTAFTHKNFYQLDLRLLERVQTYASSFPADFQAIINQSQQIYIKQPAHFLSDFFISQINQRFNNLTINAQAINSASNSKTILQIFHISPQFTQHKVWKQLTTQDRFLKFLEHLEERYWVEQELYQILSRDQDIKSTNNKKSSKNNVKSSLNTPKPAFISSIRKPIKPISIKSSYKTQISQQLFKKLFFYYYFQLIRTFCSSKNNIQRANTLRYHVQLGRNILKIISADYISEQNLFQLLYNIIKIQKISKSLNQLQSVTERYQVYCLKHEYNLSIDKNKLQSIKLYARCYLDEMYFLAVKQAQDPQIVNDSVSSDSGFILKNFPINRVKQRNRNM